MARRRAPMRQGGWGVLVLLLGVLIVGLVVGALLRQQFRTDAASPRGDAVERAGAAAPGSSPAPDAATAAELPPRTARERAKGLEAAVHQQAQEVEKKIDDAAK